MNNFGVLIKSALIWKTSIYGIILCMGIIFTSCNQPMGPVNNNKSDLLKALDKQTLAGMISRLNQALAQDISSDIRKPFQKWQKENTVDNPDHTITNTTKLVRIIQL